MDKRKDNKIEKKKVLAFAGVVAYFIFRMLEIVIYSGKKD